mmetsp:Transcript_140113/g.390604  ORF Transcript_140113/g.390604 Transcript_140113/m.390604 type:complete len:206 (+) Transcript_140113:61-678(+)
MRDGASKVFHFKLVVLGDTCVGKSSLCARFAKGEFNECQEPSIGAAFMTQKVHLGKCIVAFEIWDTAGQERYRSLAPSYYRGAGAAVVVFDITSRGSFDAAKGWVEELHGTDTLIALAGNKSDLSASRTVDREVAWAYADSMGIIYMETSAKSGQNVNEFFHEIASWLPKKSRSEDKDGRAGFRIDLADEVSRGPPASSSWCCSS